jgi:acetyl-CoA synthetase
VNESLRRARDLLIEYRDHYERAVTEFRWPHLGDRFNWAVDWFGEVAQGNTATALRIIGEDGSDASYSFADLAIGSDLVATWLADQGVRTGERVMVMLGNQVELWESMLAILKLGGVIMPATTALGPKELADRMGRGAVQHVITNADQIGKFESIAGDYGRYAVGAEQASWRSYDEARQIEVVGSFRPQTRPEDPMLVYFTSGTTSQPKLVEHTHRS